ncbi:MAG: nuclear transport factor 2 family protein [Thermoleophilaceae bacterium]
MATERASGGANVVRRVFAAFNRGDSSEARELWTEDAEWRPAYFGGGLVEGAVYRGQDEIADFIAVQADTWESLSATPLAFREAGGRVLVEVQIEAVGRTSGLPVERMTWNVFELRDGRIASGRVYTTEADALDAFWEHPRP